MSNTIAPNFHLKMNECARKQEVTGARANSIKGSHAIITMILSGVLVTSQAAPVNLGVNQSARIADLYGNSVVLQHVSNTSRTDYKAGQYYADTGDIYGVGSIISYANVTKLSFTGSGQSSVSQLFDLDPLVDPSDPYAYLRYEARVTSPGQNAIIDNNTGEVLGFNGSEAGTISGTRIYGYHTGGKFTISNLRFDLRSNVIVANGTGTSLPVGTTPEKNYNLPNIPVFSYPSVTGPRFIPVHAFSKGQNTRLALESAGFRIWSISSSKVTFFALYKFPRIRLTPEGIQLFGNSFNQLATGRNSLSAVNEDPAGLGDILVNVMFSAPIAQ